jgi:hypothetical protein
MKTTLAGILALAFALNEDALARTLPAQERTVVLLTIDGFPSWLWKDPYC